jgi:iron complex transport system ATP-binding protein
LLRADRVSFAYRGGAPVLEAVSLAVARGDLVGVIGPNGSGKTTLLKILGGMLHPASGTVFLGDNPLGSWSRRDVARRIAFVPQETHSSFDFSVLDVVLMGRFPHLGAFALEGPEDLAIARDALQATGTSLIETRSFNTLSGGEKQRVVIAVRSPSARTPAPRRADRVVDVGHQLEVTALLARLNRSARHDGADDARSEFRASLCRHLMLVRDGRSSRADRPARC